MTGRHLYRHRLVVEISRADLVALREANAAGVFEPFAGTLQHRLIGSVLRAADVADEVRDVAPLQAVAGLVSAVRRQDNRGRWGPTDQEAIPDFT